MINGRLRLNVVAVLALMLCVASGTASFAEQ
jgi:hypothetical protein